MFEFGYFTHPYNSWERGFNVESANGKEILLEVDNVVISAGQEPLRELYDDLVAAGKNVQLIGGANVATELDAKRVIDQASRLAAAI